MTLIQVTWRNGDFMVSQLEYVTHKMSLNYKDQE